MTTSRIGFIGAAVVVVIAAGIGVRSWLGSSSSAQQKPPPEIGPALHRQAVDKAVIPAVKFTDVTDKAGIRFRHVNGAFGQKLLPETMGAGVAFIDYDNDGHQDLIFVNSCYWPGHKPEGKTDPTLACYHNRGDGTFEDVTKEVGLDVTMYGMGVTVGDFDNDGLPDLFVTGVGGNRLFRNVKEGGKHRFVDVTREMNAGGPGGLPAGNFLAHKDPVNFSSSAAFLDYDNDGWLDLFVCNYITWSPDHDLKQGFKITGDRRAYGAPLTFEGAQCFLYRNIDGKRFEDVSASAGIQVHEKIGFGDSTKAVAVGKAMGVIVCDVDDDGWPDIVVANDTVRNFFFHNMGNGKFQEVGRVSGVAYAESQARGAMGIDWGEYRPGKPALVIGNFANEPNTFLRLENPKKLFFADAATAEGIAGPSRILLKFGAFFFDYDLDGRLDLLTCNGHLEPEISTVQSEQTYAQPAQLFWNSASRPCFEPVGPEHVGADLFRPLVGRGCAFADIDGDGDLDVVLTENNGPARLLRNEGGTGHHWIRFVLEGDGKRSNRSAIGARVTVEAGGVSYHRQVTSGRGYLSQSELPLTFGLGKTAKIDKVTIQWPGRNVAPMVRTDLEVDRVHRIGQE